MHGIQAKENCSIHAYHTSQHDGSTTPAFHVILLLAQYIRN